jgi:glycosyltransferase involved in cell wall biosynthesis
MGWHWVTSLANYCRLTVLTESGFQKEIESSLAKVDLKYPPCFHYVDVGNRARRRFWAHGDWRFYWDYRKWQLDAYRLAIELLAERSFDLVHHLNMIGYREPGYLWRLKVPFVWGPVGGHGQMPWAFFTILGLPGSVYYGTRNLLNTVQARTSLRVRAAARNAVAIIAATKEDQWAIRQIHGRNAAVVNEQGAACAAPPRKRGSIGIESHLNVAWAGVFRGRKALPILLRAVARTGQSDRFRLHVLGNGPEWVRWQRLAGDLGLNRITRWYGRIDHAKALEVMRCCDVLAFTGLLEGTTAVIMEAMEMGLPVLCHDTCGFGDVVDESCGIKIPVRSPAHSIEQFAESLLLLADDPSLVDRLGRGAYRRAESLTWDSKAREMIALYQRALALS